MVTEARPPNVRAAPLPGSMAAPAARTAAWAAPTSSGCVPKTLVSATRRREPPIVARTICRSV